MIKADLAQIVYETHGGISSSEAAAIVDEILQLMKNSLQQGSNVKLTSFGTLAVTRRKSRTGRNPQTGGKIQLPPSSYVSFRPSRSLDF